jgi:hypothetical protein
VSVQRRSIASIVSIAVAAALSLGAFACGGKPSAADCDKLVKHIIDLEAAEAGGGAVPAEQRADLEQRKKSVFQAVGTTYCRDEMSASQVSCGLEAKTLGELSTKCES